MNVRASSNGRPKVILACVGHYPSPYKPYYDTQFAEFLRAGYDLRIAAAPPLDRTVNEKVLTSGLLSRLHYYPTEGRSARLSTAGRMLVRPFATARFMRTARVASLRRTAVDMLRMLALPSTRPDAILIHEMVVALRFGWFKDWFRDVPLGLYYHGGEVASIPAHQQDAVARMFRSVDMVFTNTRFSRQHAVDRGCPPEKIVTVPVGFDLNDYRLPAARAYRPNGVLRLLSAGRMSEEKGFEYALEALRMVVASGRTQIRYSFTADGYMRPKLEAYVKEHGLEPYVRFLGTLTTGEVIAAMAAADALVLSSVTVGNWTENQACAVQEAMLMKAVVVTTQTGGVPESIPQAMRRFSVPERDTAALARAITEVYDLRGAELVRLGDEGRSFVEARYDIRHLNEQMTAALWA